MASIALSLFEPYQLMLTEHGPVKLDSDKTRALFAYLALEANRPHARKRLAALFWPDSPAPRANLSQALHVLRKVLENPAATTPLFLADANHVRINPAFDLTVDVRDFQHLIQGCASHRPRLQADCADCIERCRKAVAVARDEFLADLTLDQCEEFEGWLIAWREQLRRQRVETQLWLIEGLQRQGHHRAGLEIARALISHDPLNEEGQMLYLRLLLAHGQRVEARQHLEWLQQWLTEEGFPQPSPALLQLVWQIPQAEEVGSREAEPAASPTAPLTFVGRLAEFDHLQRLLTRMLTGEVQVAFVTGEAGVGKSALLRHFADQVQRPQPELLVVQGNCNAHTGIGDPYLPFREVLALLTGDVERQLRVAAIDATQAAHLQQFAPQTMQTLTTLGADLIGSFLAADALLARLLLIKQDTGDWVGRLRTLADQAEKNRTGSSTRPQSALFEQYTAMLQAIAAQRPLLLLLDDLQWADLGTIHLLFHLARKLTGARILLIGAYRPSDVWAGRNGQRHPLEPVLYEVQRLYGEVEVPLDAADGRRFVEALLDREANLLSPHFRQQLFHYTQGNALFTVELLRGMQERGDLLRDGAGRWVEAATLAWDRLPPRIEAVIAERIGRLPPELRETLELASVEGEQFTVEVLAHLQQVDHRQVVRWLGSELDRQHQLVQMQSITQLGEQIITRYRFRHILFQKYLYGQLDAAQRLIAHGDAAARLEVLYADQTEAQEEMAGQLAWHYEEARQWLKAAGWLVVSGRRALRVSALEEAMAACQKAVTFLQKTAATEQQQRFELDLQITLGNAFVLKEGYASRSAMQSYERAEVLSLRLGELDKLLVVLAGLCSTTRINAYLDRSKEIGERMVRLVEGQPDPSLRAIAHVQLGATLVNMGQLIEARRHLECAQAYLSSDFASTHPHPHAAAHNSFVMTYSYLAYVLCPLGFLDQAQTYTEFAIHATWQSDQPNDHAFALFLALLVQLMRRDARQAEAYVAQLGVFAAQHESIGFWITWLPPHLAWIAFEQGQIAQSLEMLSQWLPPERFAERTVSPLSWQFAMLLVAQCKADQIEQGLALAEKVLQHNDHLNEHWWTAEIHRLHGELLLRRPNVELDESGDAERALQCALHAAQKQQAKLWELRAATSLAQLWRKQGRTQDSYVLLKEVYEWFTEGFDAYDLQKARQLLQKLEAECT